MADISILVHTTEAERAPKAGLLNIMMCCLAGVLALSLIAVLVLRLPQMGASLISILIALVTCIFSYWLNRIGKLLPAVYVFLAGFIIVANSSILLPNVATETRVIAPFLYSFAVVIAGMLTTPVASFWFATFGTVVFLVAVAVGGGVSLFSVSGDPRLGWAVISTPITCSYVLASRSWLSSSSSQRSLLTLQRHSEELLAVYEELRATEEELRSTNEELETAYEELREAQEELIRSEKLAAVGQLASGVGHELRNPLGAIKNAVFYVKRRLAKSDLPDANPRVLEFLDIIDGEVDAANKVISDLLGFSRVAKPTVSPTSVSTKMEDVPKYLHLPKDMELVTEMEDGLPMVQVDTDQIRQVSINMMLNAQEAMPKGGRLTVPVQTTGEFVEVKFTDTGCGTPASIMSKVFDPLFTTKGKGVGLGLSVCHSIVERHGGSITVESEEGKGSTFTFSIPLTNGKSA